MRKKVIVAAVILILITVGLSGCEEEASDTHAHIEGNFEIELWFYSCFNETNVSGDSWVDYFGYSWSQIATTSKNLCNKQGSLR